jgi:hypothetical protein
MPPDEQRLFHEQAALIRKWAKYISALHLMHWKAAETYRKVNSVFQYFILVASPVLGITTIMDTNKVVTYVVGAVNMGIGVLTAINRWKRPSEKSDMHIMYAKNYEVLYRKIQTELSLRDEENESTEDLLKDIRMEMDKYADNAPHFPSSVLAYFEKNHPNVYNVVFAGISKRVFDAEIEDRVRISKNHAAITRKDSMVAIEV